MLGFCISLLSLGTALAGVSFHTPYLSNAVVSYNRGDAVVSPAVVPQVDYAYGNVYSIPRALVVHPSAYSSASTAHVVPPPAVVPYTFVSDVQHLPALPSYDAQHVNIQNVVDIHHPKVSTRKFEIRRPAIEKQFYDIEERIVVRPAGKAVVELEQPVSKEQQGPAVVSSIPPVDTVSLVHPFPAASEIHEPVSGIIHSPVSSTQSPLNVLFMEPPQNPDFPVPSQNFPRPPENEPPPQFDDSDSVTIENAEIANARSQQLQQQNRQPSHRFQSSFVRSGLIQPGSQFQYQQLERRQPPLEQNQQNQQPFEKTSSDPKQGEVQARVLTQNPQFNQVPQTQLFHYNYQNFHRTSQSLQNPELKSVQEDTRPANLFRQSLNPHFSGEARTVQTVSNQERFIDLLTARGGVAEVRGFDENTAGGNLGGVRARVLSVTAAPPTADQQGEKVSTRRIVVNRPITTVEEVDVIEPFTKVERVAVNQPALIKTSKLSVPTAVPLQHYAFTASPHLI